jgi:hypothetical protein
VKAKLLHFISGGTEYIVLSTGEDPDKDFCRQGFRLSGSYPLDTLADDDEWPSSLPVDMELTK